MLSIRPRGLGVPVVGVRGMQLLVAVPLPFPVLFLGVGDSPVTSAWAGRFFCGSGGWNDLKMKDASLYGPASMVRIVLWRLRRRCLSYN